MKEVGQTKSTGGGGRGLSAALRRDNNNTAYKTIRYYTSYSLTLKHDTNLIYIKALGVAMPDKEGHFTGPFWRVEGKKGCSGWKKPYYWPIFGLPPNNQGLGQTASSTLRDLNRWIYWWMPACLQSASHCKAGSTHVNTDFFKGGTWPENFWSIYNSMWSYNTGKVY